MNVYTYWECPYCNSIVRGDSRSCPNCGSPIPNGTKYMMPDDPRVIKAQREGKILVGGKTHTDERGIVSEVVSEEKERKAPNWQCGSCGYMNFAEDTVCKGCGAPKSSKTYFDNDEEEVSDTDDEGDVLYESSDLKIVLPPTRAGNVTIREEYVDEDGHTKDREKTFTVDIPVTEEPQKPEKKPISLWKKLSDFFKDNWKPILAGLGIIALVAFLIWLFMPVKRTATVTGFEWQQTIKLEEFTLCHESDWSVPPGGRITSTAEEIHHYDTVLDHYETKTRTVSEQVQDGYETKTRQVSETVLDGYDTSYRDLGNGQAEVVQTPRYRTEYHTETYEVPKYKTVYHEETYQEPVYVEVPVYQTKYYYDIDKWLYGGVLTAHEQDHEPYWITGDYPEEVADPSYGDIQLGERNGAYWVVLQNDKEEYKTQYNLPEWQEFAVGDVITYKSFRFSYKPLTETVVEHREE